MPAHHILSLNTLRRIGLSALFIALVCSLTTTLGACAKAPDEGRTSEVPVHDTRIAALESMAVGYHKRADIALVQKNRDQAKTEMIKLRESWKTHNIHAPASYDVFFDASTRLARFHLEDRETSQALKMIQETFSTTPSSSPSLFRGYLHQVHGEALEQHGDLKGAVEAYDRSIRDFQAVLQATQPKADPNPSKSGPSHAPNQPK